MTKPEEMLALYLRYAQTGALQEVSDARPPVLPGGPLDTPLMVVGEAPGEDEENAGEPFVGPAGRLLQELFAKAGLPWSMTCRTNVLPWRPPRNRTPYPFEIQASADRVAGEVLIVRPFVLIAVGAVAWQAITRNQHGYFGAHRGRWMRWSPDGHEFACDLLAIYHPGHLLRSPSNRRPAEEEETVTALRSVLEGQRA
jgi:uracil-DNA glycosylase family 4